MESINSSDNVRGMGERLIMPGAILAVLVVVYVTGTIIYNRFFHPLAKFSGPFLNAVSDVSDYSKAYEQG
jgi:hypothetical protein